MADLQSTETVPHTYHMVKPSPWPALVAFSAFLIPFGLVLFMHPETLGSNLEGILDNLGIATIIPGVALMLGTTYLWWRDVVLESQSGDHTPLVQLGLRYGMSLFICSEIMFFVAFFWAYFEAGLFYDQTIQFMRVALTGGVWPPQGLVTFDPFTVPFLNTLILLLSGTTVTWSHHALREGNRDGFIWGLGITVLLGMAFTSFQAYEYVYAGFGFKDGIYASTFYMATGFHGFHVIVGTIFLAVCFFRGLSGHFTPTHHFGLEAAAWYWHFVDIVWLFLFVSIYWYGS